MFFITIDRLLEFKLNINYPLYWRPKKTVTTTTAIFAVFTAVFACTFVLNRLKILKCHIHMFLCYVVVVVPVQGVFLVLAGYTYYVIFLRE